MNEIQKYRVVTGTIGDDIHSLGIKVIEHALKKAGFLVVSVGIQTPQEDFIKAALEADAHAILISSMSGHARLLCEGMRERCIEAGLDDVLLYLGGNLSVGPAEWEEVREIFLKMGYNRVYSTSTMPGELVMDLSQDISAKLDVKRTVGD